MEWLIELLFEIFGEFVLQFLFEALAQAGMRLFSRPGRRPIPAWSMLLGYLVLGALAGWLSLLVFKQCLLLGHLARLSYLFLAPVLVGAGIALIGSWRTRQGRQAVGLDRFIFGYAFAFAFALVRYFMATCQLG